MTAVKSGDEARTTTAGKSGDEEGDRNQRATGVETEDTLTYPLRVSGDDKIALDYWRSSDNSGGNVSDSS